MTLAVTHTKVSAIADDPAASAAGEVLPSDWNAAHTITGDISNYLANPTGSLGLTAVNGTAATAMRSDAAPALDQTIAPTWLALHKFNAGITLNGSTTNSSPILFTTNNANDIGANGSGSPRDIYAGRNVIATADLNAGVNLTIGNTGYIQTPSRSNFNSPANGTWQLANAAVSQYVYFSFPGTHVLQLGQLAAASPVAQTLQAQGSRSGTDTNVGGANLTVTPGTGTGTGTLSSLILQSPVAVASGTGAQTQTTSLTIKGGQAVASAYTVATLPTGIAGGFAYVTDGDASLAWGATVVNSGAGTTKYLVWYNGSNWTVQGK